MAQRTPQKMSGTRAGAAQAAAAPLKTDAKAQAKVNAADNKPIFIKMLRSESVFQRDARELQREERNRYASLIWNVMRLDMGPKVRLADMVGQKADQALDYRHEAGLKSSLDYYHGKNAEELIRVLKFFAVYLIQQARKEDAFVRQLFLLFKAVDLLRMIVQHSRYAVNVDAETIVYGIMIDLGTQKPQRFDNYMRTESKIHELMRRLRGAPNDNQVRLAMADQMVAQTSLFDALVQYHMLLRTYPNTRQEQDRRRGFIFLKMAQVFQNIADSIREPVYDGRKLKSFVERYNRDYARAGQQLPTLETADSATLRSIRPRVLALANEQYARVVKVENMDARILLDVGRRLGANYIAEGNFRDAVDVLAGGYKHWKSVEETSGTLRSRLEYLESIIRAAERAGRKDVVEWAQKVDQIFKKRQEALSAQAEVKKRKREELLGGSPDDVL
jgi:hypothetical protein